MSLGPDDVRDVTFSLALISKNAYDEAEVDAFLDRIEATLRGSDDLAARHVREVTFSSPSLGRRGYAKEEVDAFLSQVVQTLEGGHAPTTG
ncbi:hypothetical protein GCM10010174_04350 [Kutzneria viridogrisea]|uniref:Cell wall synthesis protein Wag31 n=2 Tax=Kutzneria TaxID=43356 RepID=W5VZ32_9PSEU|nr:DivIVA domain-containing protein [Kutzneria albida]AHH94158.1 hypothetical protein KALB_784 [Kutzneria albida DSM 43870]MBA8929831.1 DivIVA domain-containing protein [Kutzneria viridogrisea]